MSSGLMMDDGAKMDVHVSDEDCVCAWVTLLKECVLAKESMPEASVTTLGAVNSSNKPTRGRGSRG